MTNQISTNDLNTNNWEQIAIRKQMKIKHTENWPDVNIMTKMNEHEWTCIRMNKNNTTNTNKWKQTNTCNVNKHIINENEYKTIKHYKTNYNPEYLIMKQHSVTELYLIYYLRKINIILSNINWTEILWKKLIDW